MKTRIPKAALPSLNRTSAFGFVLSALGLISGCFGISKAVAALAGEPVSPRVLAVSLLTGLFLSGAGFLLLVAAADPFEDVPAQFTDAYSQTSDQRDASALTERTSSDDDQSMQIRDRIRHAG